MNRTRSLLAVVGLAAIAGSIALAQPAKETKPGATPAAKPTGQPELPPGMSEADAKACQEAATPGKMHEHLQKTIGVWTGKNTIWMAPGAEPMKSEGSTTISSFMDGRFTKSETTGDMMGMPFKGFGLYGFDNVGQKFQSTWIDNCGTGMMQGTGELSADGKSLTWNYAYNCPIAKKAVKFRIVEKYTGKDTMTMEMFGPEPHSGKEFKTMEILYTRKAGSADAGGTR